MTFAAPRHRLPAHWALTLASAIAFALIASDASALFIVNQPWVRPAGKAQTTYAYMNLTSTDGARLLEAHSDDGTVHEIPVNAEVRLRSPIDDERRAHHH